MSASRYTAVGVFDSGVGGLTVVAALRRLNPALPIRYIADGAWFPYGERTSDEIEERSLFLTEALVAEGCAPVVVACNTASSSALERLRERFDVPIVGMEPPLKPAVERTRTGRVAVLATPSTVRGERLARLQDAYGGGVEVTAVPMPGLADLVESGHVAGERVEQLLHRTLGSLAGSGIDQVALGCTHYGFLRATFDSMLDALLGADVDVIDPAEPVARRALHQLEAHGITVPTADPAPPVVCSTTGDPAAFAESVARLRADGADLPPLDISSAPFEGPLPIPAAPGGVPS
ncbi:MAG: glutamate racemase [Dehalococcoidia bacterium]